MRRDVTDPTTAPEALEALEAMERARVRALVAADIDAAGPVHADDFQLITPSGRALSKSDYLGAIASGRLRYLAWDPEGMTVRLYGAAAVLRYQAELQTAADGVPNPRWRHWHTDLYEIRDGRWQVVWSQATAIDYPG